MGKIDLVRFDQSNEYVNNEFTELKFLANAEALENIFNFFSSSNDILNSNRTCYIYGYGSQPKSTYTKLKEKANDNYDVKWFGYKGPKKFKLLSFIAASSSGLILMRNAQYIKPLLATLSHLSMVGIFSLTNTFSMDFENAIMNSVDYKKFDPEHFAKQDRSFFYCVIDGDSYNESDDGFLCKTAFAKECPEGLLKMTRFTNKNW